MRLFLDECLSPSFALRLNATGEHNAMHPRDYGRLPYTYFEFEATTGDAPFRYLGCLAFFLDDGLYVHA